MTITREYLEKRIAELTAARVEQLKIASNAQTLAHTLNGAIQDAQHMVKMLGSLGANYGVGTGVAMEAEVRRAGEVIQMPSAEGESQKEG